MLPKALRIESKAVYKLRNSFRFRSEFGVLGVSIAFTRSLKNARKSAFTTDEILKKKRNSASNNSNNSDTFGEHGRFYPRFGFVIPKKVGNAVKRNRMRRLLSSIVFNEGLKLVKNLTENEFQQIFKDKQIYFIYYAYKFGTDYEILKKQYCWQLHKGLDMLKSSQSQKLKVKAAFGSRECKF